MLAQPVNPARAGMIRDPITVTQFTVSKPRASGDDPEMASAVPKAFT